MTGQGKYGPAGPERGRPLTQVGNIDDLYLGLRRAKIGNPNCDGETMVVVDLPDGSSWTVESVRYEEDLAGALVIEAGRQLPAGDPDGPAAGERTPAEAVYRAAQIAAGFGDPYADDLAEKTADGPDFSDPADRAVTAGAEFLPGNLDVGLVPGVELGGIQVTAWRQAGALQVDVLLEDARPDDWTLDGNQLTVNITVAGLTVDSDQHELNNACYRCGNDNTGGDGYMGLCPNCADIRGEAPRG